MNQQYDMFCEMLYQRDLTTKKQLLTEALRVGLTEKYLQKKKLAYEELKEQPEELFEVMKQNPEVDHLGYFPGDRDLFHRLFDLGRNFDILDFAVATYKNDRSGTVISPRYLTDYLKQMIEEKRPRTVLIAEGEKYLVGLKSIIQHFPDTFFTVITDNFLMNKVMKLAFRGYPNVEVNFLSIYRRFPVEKKYDLIMALPSFLQRFAADELVDNFITQEGDGIATQNLLSYITEKGCLNIIVPAKFTFSGGNLAKLREWIISEYYVESIYILPEGIFRPYTGIKTYMLTITNAESDLIRLGDLVLEEDKFVLATEQEISLKELRENDYWKVDLYLSEKQEEIQRYETSEMPKIKLGEGAEVFRGKSIMKRDLKPGEWHVLNISNIEDGEILSQEMETIDEEERKLLRYEVQAGDLVITCRGTVTKIAVMPELKQRVIASANIIVIRPKIELMSHYLKIFLESPVGSALLSSLQRGTTVMNINPKDVAEMEVPVPELEEQEKVVAQYLRELELYRETIRQATLRWQNHRNNIYDNLLK